MSRSKRFRQLPVLAIALALFSACGKDSTAPSDLVGVYWATTFEVTLAGQSPIDVLAAGGSLQIQIATDNSTSGTLIVPASLNDGEAMDASMAGTAVQSDNRVVFQQSADTFVRDLTWSYDGSTLRVTNQTAGVGSFTITLTRGSQL